MDRSASRAEAMKPVLLKAGITLVVSAAGLIFARFMTRREDRRVTSSASNSETASPCADGDEEEEEEEEKETGVIGNSETPDEQDHKQEIVSLKTRFEELQTKEFELEARFVHFCNLKDEEYVLMELKRTLKLEKVYLDFFRREISTIEAENKRIQDWVIIYLKVLEEVQGLRSENDLLQRKVKRLTRRTKALPRVIREKNMKMGGVERKLLRSLDELEMKSNTVRKMEDEVKELKTAIDLLQEEKNELLSKSSNSKTEIECGGTTVTVEDYKRFLEEYENLQRDRADEVKELIYLRWTNACLRHELMRNSGHDQENGTHLEEIAFGENGNCRNFGFEDQTDGLPLGKVDERHDHLRYPHEEHHNVCSKRKKLLKKLKRWVEGNEKRKLTGEPEEEQIVLAGRSCSSA